MSEQRRPLAVDLFCGLGGWTEGLLAAEYDVIGFDNERHEYWVSDRESGMKLLRYPAQLVLQNVLTLHGRQFKNAALIVASPPCQEYSYMAMPWSRAKKIQAEYLSGERDVRDLTRLFDACFRIQREACEAAGRHIPLVVENVRGAQKWVGRARWNYGSFYLWGDVPALMPIPRRIAKVSGLNWSKWEEADYKASGRNQPLYAGAIKNNGGSWFNVAHNTTSGKGNNPVRQKGVPHRTSAHWTNPAENGTKRRNEPDGDGYKGFGNFDAVVCKHGSKSNARKAASAMIAKIPFELAYHIGRVYSGAAPSAAL